MTDPIDTIVDRSMRSGSISLAYTDRRNGRDVAKIRAARHSFPEDLLGTITEEPFRIRSVYAVLRDTLHDDYVLIETPEEFEPVPVVVVGESP